MYGASGVPPKDLVKNALFEAANSLIRQV